MAYESNESGQSEIYVRPLPDIDAGRWQVSPDGGNWPVWAPNGRELFYRRPSDGAVMVVTVETDTTFTHGPAEVLFDAPDLLSEDGPPRQYDIHPDGERFLMIRPGVTSTGNRPAHFNIVFNWLDQFDVP